MYAKLPNQRSKDRNPPRKFSSLIKQLVVELDRDPTLYPEGNVVEVRTPPLSQYSSRMGTKMARGIMNSITHHGYLVGPYTSALLTWD